MSHPLIHSEFLLRRHPANPILKPSDFPGGADGVRNCGQTMLGDETILLVSVDHTADGYRGRPGRTTHVARSKDGINFTIDAEPFFQWPAPEREPFYSQLDQHPIDARVTKIGDTYFIARPGGGWGCKWGTCVILNKTTDFRSHEYVGIIGLPQNRGASLFPEKIAGRYAKLDRPSKSTEEGNLWISYSPDLIHWGDYRPVLAANYATWNYYKIGPTPPIRTAHGWLVIIHGVTGSCAGKRYLLGAVLLDLGDPSRVIGKTMSFILAPYAWYEQTGRVPNVVYACGAIPDYAQDRLRVYYGASDTCIGLATGSIGEIVDACQRGL
jgi:beta-1,4-mannooligosaccharide/beta-1,4-mannosyl-N-acetylglucosamine phosphorylase